MKIQVTSALTLSLLCVCTQATADRFGVGVNEFEIEFAVIGDPGNPAEWVPSSDPSGNPGPLYRVGTVEYVYRIGKFEVSRDMVEKANAEGSLGIDGGWRPDQAAATGVSWNEAARFINWLNTSQGFPGAYKFSTTPADPDYDANENIELWADGDDGYDPSNPFRNRLAKYFLPSVHEWHKAAYFDSVASSYWDFATGSNVAPTAVSNGTAENTAVYHQGDAGHPANITQAGGLSPYGMMAMSGNVWEWDETAFDLTNDDGSAPRAVHGGSWINTWLPHLSSSSRSRVFDPNLEDYTIGFRVASIPEPTSRLLMILGAVALLLRRQRRIAYH